LWTGGRCVCMYVCVCFTRPMAKPFVRAKQPSRRSLPAPPPLPCPGRYSDEPVHFVWELLSLADFVRPFLVWNPDVRVLVAEACVPYLHHLWGPELDVDQRLVTIRGSPTEAEGRCALEPCQWGVWGPCTSVWLWGWGRG
jgi:hypothetical protein